MLSWSGTSQLTADLLPLKEEVVLIRIELARLSAVQAECATKADMKAIDANLKGWTLAITLSLMTSVFAIVYPLYSLLKPTVVPKPVAVEATQARRIVAPVAAAPSDTK